MKIVEEIKKPFNFLSLFVALISIILTIVFYLKAQKEMSPSYTTIKSAYTIFDSQISSPKIILSDNKGNEIKENVYLLETVFWNAGELPIEPESVRSPIKLVIDSCKKILDFKILDQIKPEIANIEVYPDSLHNNSLFIKWDHLDPGFGAKIQIIFTGSSEARVDYFGYIVGVKSFKNIPSVNEKSLFYRIFDAILGMIIGVAIPMFIFMVITFFKRSLRDLAWKSRTVYVVITIAILLFILRFYFLDTPNPPF